MTAEADTPSLDADEAMLARLAALDLAAAERVHEKLMAAEEPAEIAELARAYRGLSRSLRQTLIFKGKLRAERDGRLKAEERKAAGERSTRVGDHQERIFTRLDRLVAEALEVESDEQDREALRQRLHDQILEQVADAVRRDDFLDTPVDLHAARIALSAGLVRPAYDDSA